MSETSLPKTPERGWVARFWQIPTRRGWGVFVVLLAVAAYFAFVAFDDRKAELNRLVSEDSGGKTTSVSAPDVQMWRYDAGWLRNFAQNLPEGKEARRYFIRSQRRLDILFPIVYGFMFAVGIAAGWEYVRARRTCPARPLHDARWLLLPPVLAVVFDYAENETVIWLLGLPPDQWPLWLANAAGWFTVVKWLLSFLSFVILVVGGVWAFRVCLKEPKT